MELDFLRRQCKLLEASTPGSVGGEGSTRVGPKNLMQVACNTSTAILISLIFEMEIAALGRCININVRCTLSARDVVWIHVGKSF